ncbi:MAG: phage tail tip lysozyme [Pseudomonadota bacterium]
MAASIIDSFLVTLGIDDSQYQKGIDDAKKGQDGLTANVKRNDSDREKADKKLADAKAKQSKSEVEQAKKASDGYKNLRRDALALLSVFTAGVGIAKFFGSTINGAASLGFLSDNLKISTERLSAWQRASERAGGSAEGITAQLKESADTLAQLGSGLGPNEGLQWFFRLGGSSSDLKDGNSYLLARSKIISDLFKTDPSNAALMARQMGISEEQFDLLKQGPDAVIALVNAQEKNSAVTRKAADDALALKNSWLDFSDSLQATTRTIILTLAPAITAVMQRFAKWADTLGENKDAIRKLGDDVSSFLLDTDWSGIIAGAEKFAGAIGVIASGVKDIAVGLNGVMNRWDEFTGKPKIQTEGVTKMPGALRIGKTEDLDKDSAATGKPVKPKVPLTGWKKDVTESIEMAFARTLASLGHKASAEFVRDTTGKDLYGAGPKKPRNDVATGNGNPPPPNPQTAQEVVKKLKGMGWTDAQAAGITASFIQESSLNPAATNPTSGMYGIGQWSRARRADFKEWAGKAIEGSSLDEQLRFFQYEVTKGKETSAGAALRATRTPEEAARVHSEAYERPGEAESNIPRRQRIAGELAQQAKTVSVNATLAMPSGAAAAAPATSITNNAGNKTATSTTEVKIGTVNVTTQATDAQGMAKGMVPAIKYAFTNQANTGVN